MPACARCNRRRGHMAPSAYLADCRARGLTPDRARRSSGRCGALREAIAVRGGQRRARPYLERELRRLGVRRAERRTRPGGERDGGQRARHPAGGPSAGGVDVGTSTRGRAVPTLTSWRQVNVGTVGQRAGLPTLPPFRGSRCVVDVSRAIRHPRSHPSPYPAAVPVDRAPLAPGAVLPRARRAPGSAVRKAEGQPGLGGGARSVCGQRRPARPSGSAVDVEPSLGA